MQDSLLVRGGQAVCDLGRKVERRAHREGAARQPGAQRLPVEQLRHDVGGAIEDADVVDREDVRMIQRGCGARFLLEALQPARIGGCVRGQNLDRDVTTGSRIPAAIDLAHASRAEQRVDLVWTEVDTGCQRHA
jgi:hypothetical protein